MATEGMISREIAQALTVTEKTVERRTASWSSVSFFARDRLTVPWARTLAV